MAIGENELGPNSQIPLVDLALDHREVAEEVRAGWDRVLARATFVNGPEVERFEAEFARFCGVAHCVGVASGTDALELALRAVGVGPGTDVIVPAATFVATALAVLRAGGRPVLVDVDEESSLISAPLVAGRLDHRVRAVVPVHLYGQMVPVDELLSAVAGTDAVVVEDAAQAHGATRASLGVGALGAAAATSFYPSKNLGASGHGGAVLTTSEAVAARVRALGNFGSDRKYHHPTAGFNSQLDELQAVVLRAKLTRLAARNERRRAAAARYDLALAGEPRVRRLRTLPGNAHVHHLYVVRVPRRDRVLDALRRAGIGAAVHYPVPVHLHGALRSLGYAAGDFPAAEALSAEVLSLPLYPEITPAQQERVVSRLVEALG